MTVLEQLRTRRAAVQAEIDTRQTELDGILARTDGEITDELNARGEALIGEIGTRRTTLTQLDGRIGELGAAEQREAAAGAARVELGTTGREERADGSSRVEIGAEPRTYTQATARTGTSFFSDMYRARFSGDFRAAERLQRHQREAEVHGELVARDVGTSAFGALIPPQYLLDLYAPAARAGRPVANAVQSAPLPAEGMTLNIPRGTTNTATAAQATENSAIQETDYDETTLTVNVRTIAGQQDISRQALERGTAIDMIIFADLANDYATQLDAQVVAGAGTSGTHLGITATSGIEAVTYTDASPTLSELHPKIADAVQRINSLRYQPATVVFMHPRRWGWMTAQVDTTGRPLVTSESPMNPLGVGQAAAYGQVVGTMAAFGLPVVTDANIPTNLGAGTNEDIIIVARATDLLLWEENGGAPRQLKFEETLAGQLTVKLVAYGYSAFSAGRYPKAVATVGGTGLVPPTF